MHLQHELVKGNLAPGTLLCLNELQVLSTPHGSSKLSTVATFTRIIGRSLNSDLVQGKTLGNWRRDLCPKRYMPASTLQRENPQNDGNGGVVTEGPRRPKNTRVLNRLSAVDDGVELLAVEIDAEVVLASV